MAQDEGRFGRMSTPTRCWAPPGMRPEVPSQQVREYTYVYAAVAAKQGLMTALVLPRADTAMMNLFLEHVSLTFADFFLVIQVDQAAWHRSKALVIPENIRLIEAAGLQSAGQSGGAYLGGTAREVLAQSPLFLPGSAH